MAHFIVDQALLKEILGDRVMYRQRLRIISNIIIIIIIKS